MQLNQNKNICQTKIEGVTKIFESLLAHVIHLPDSDKACNNFYIDIKQSQCSQRLQMLKVMQQVIQVLLFSFA